MLEELLKKSILIVEDDEVISNSIQELLEESGYSTIIASNGQVALDLLTVSKRPDLILLDLMMPVLDGFKFRELQLSRPEISEIPVIIMSAGGHDIQKKVMGLANGILRKPLDIAVLLEAIENHCPA